MENLADKKRLIKERLASEGIAATIKALKDLIPEDTGKYEDLLLIEARQNDTNRKRLRNVLNDQDLQIAYNQIREDIMDLINGLETADFDVTQESSKFSASKKVKRGHILHRIPNQMQYLQETRCLVRIAMEEEALIENIDLDEHIKLESLRVSDVMQVELIDPSGDEPFSIRPISSPEQFVDEDGYTEWQFYVKPLKKGTYSLLLKVAVIELVLGKERKRELVFERAVDIITTGAEDEEEEPGFEESDYRLSFTQAIPLEEDILISPRPAPSPARAMRSEGVQRAAMFMVIFVGLVGVMLAIALGEAQWWFARIILDNPEGYEAFIEGHPESRHLEKAWWRKAELTDEPEEYLAYLERYPEAERAGKDGLGRPQLEEKLYRQLQQGKDPDVLKRYLEEFPEGKHQKELKERMEAIERGEIPREQPSDKSLGDNAPGEGSTQTLPGETEDGGTGSADDPAGGTGTTDGADPDGNPLQTGPAETGGDASADPANTNNKNATEGKKVQQDPATVDKDGSPDQTGTSGGQKPEQPEGGKSTTDDKTQKDRSVDDPSSTSGNPENERPEGTGPGDVKKDEESAPQPAKIKYGRFKDREGNIYKTLDLKGLTWMTENLQLEVSGSWCSYGDRKNCKRYGRLYTWEAARRACLSMDEGWRLPTDQEWRDLTKRYGGSSSDSNDNGKRAFQALITDGPSGFNAQLGGYYRANIRSYLALNVDGYYWTGTQQSSDSAWYYGFINANSNLRRFHQKKAWGFSCRCVRE